jgi:hypothetical protein
MTDEANEGNPNVKAYIGTKRVDAWPEERDGEAGYAVVYSDGYKSWSPKIVFEAAYEPIDTHEGLCFGTALALLKQGHMLQRAGWNGKGMYIRLQVPDENSKMRRPYLFMSPVDGDLVPWVASQSDVLADDWQLAD